MTRASLIALLTVPVAAACATTGSDSTLYDAGDPFDAGGDTASPGPVGDARAEDARPPAPADRCGECARVGCASGLACAPLGTGKSVCVPRCAGDAGDGGCPRGFDCDSAQGACIPIANVCCAPGAVPQGTELCNGADDDCNGTFDEGCPDRLVLGTSANGTRLGGGGGTTDFADACGQGRVLVGFDGMAGDRLDQVTPVCADLTLVAAPGSPEFGYQVMPVNPTPMGTHGGGGGFTFTDRCGVGDLVVALEGRSGGEIDQLQFQCARVLVRRGDAGPYGLTISATTTSAPHGGQGGVAAGYACPPGQVATGAFGRTGARVDALGISCAPIDLQVK